MLNYRNWLGDEVEVTTSRFPQYDGETGIVTGISEYSDDPYPFLVEFDDETQECFSRREVERIG